MKLCMQPMRMSVAVRQRLKLLPSTDYYVNTSLIHVCTPDTIRRRNSFLSLTIISPVLIKVTVFVCQYEAAAIGRMIRIAR